MLPLLESSLFELIWNASAGKLGNTEVQNSTQTAVTVVLAAEGYPGIYSKGMKINGLENLNDSLVFHAGTHKIGSEIYANGGRVLNAVGIGADLSSAIVSAYDIVNRVDFSGKFYRRDIGQRGLKYLEKEIII